ncbi:AMP-binding protein [Treponema sp.]|uniref:AMP-binding protein n=1 Tax=Treponema sp. TaxID=166 RepID=UPI0025806DC7|nr:AMP-binding protein [Treponema sp.]MBE6354686.1 winged helix-turn-helix transcriptional regulator [Treponema sp.]
MKLTQTKKTDILQKILQSISSKPSISFKELAVHCKLTRQTVSNYVKELINSGKLIKNKGEMHTNEMINRTYDDRMFRDTFEHEYTWLNGFMRNVRRYSKSTALIDPDQNLTLTYEQLNSEANKFAAALKNAGLGKNDVVMAALRNSPAFAISYIAPRKIGAILLAANAQLAAGEMALLIEHNKPKAIIYSANASEVVTQAVKLSEHKPAVVILADNIEKISVPEGQISYGDFIKSMPDTDPQMECRPHIYDEVLRLCTSGTTALPKSVPINDINEVLSAHDVIMQYPLSRLDRTLNMTPWFHRGGCHCAGPGPAFYVGASIVVMRNFKPQTVLDWTSKYKITFLMGAPANLEMLSKIQERDKKDISSLKGIITMGAPLSRSDCIRYSNALTPNIFNGYGTTETFWNSFLRPYDLPDGAGSVGSSCIDDEVRVVKIYEDRRAEPDEMEEHDRISEGEIIIKSPAKSSCSYYKNEKITQERYYKGWYYTGDTGTWDENWVVTIRGRKDDMMVVSGENIYPTQIEEAVNEHPKVKDCIVTSVPDKIRGQAVAAYIVAEDPSVTIEEISEFCKNSPMLSKYKRPRYYAIIKEIPRTATGKKMHYQMKERAKIDLETGFLRRG